MEARLLWEQEGSSCRDLTRDIELALGKTDSDQKKPEFFQDCQTRQETRR